MSSFQIQDLKRLRYFIEPTGSYAIDNQANLGSAFQDIKASDIQVETNLKMLDNETIQQRIDGQLPMVVGPRDSKLTVTTYLNGSGTGVSASVAPTVTPLVDVLKTVMGGVNHVTGTGIQSVGADYGKFKVDSATSIKPGSIVGFLNGTTNRMQTARVAAYNTSNNTVTCSLGMDFAPVSGAIMFGGSSMYLTQDPQESLQFFVEGWSDYDKWGFLGLQGGFSIKTEVGALPTVTFNFEGASWISGSTTNSTASLDEANYTDAVPPTLVDGLIYINQAPNSVTAARSAINQIDLASFEITPNITYDSIKSYKGVMNVVRKRRMRKTPVASGKFVAYDTGAGETLQWMQYRENTYNAGAGKINRNQWVEIMFQAGTTAGNLVAFSMPQCQITDVKRVDNGNGVTAVEVSFNCHESAVTVAASAALADVDLAKSALVIATN